MKELLRTNNAVYISFAQAILKEAGIEHLVFDSHMSVMEGSLGVLPRRLMVADEEWALARQVLAAAEPLQEIPPAEDLAAEDPPAEDPDSA